MRERKIQKSFTCYATHICSNVVHFLLHRQWKIDDESVVIILEKKKIKISNEFVC